MFCDLRLFRDSGQVPEMEALTLYAELRLAGFTQVDEQPEDGASDTPARPTDGP